LGYRFSGAKLRAARESTGLSREQLGLIIERSESLITLYELDYRPPPIDKVVELGAALGVHVETLFDSTDEVVA
jgi:transcriptional regulator with XRE-family HTH domain